MYRVREGKKFRKRLEEKSTPEETGGISLMLCGYGGSKELWGLNEIKISSLTEDI